MGRAIQRIIFGIFRVAVVMIFLWLVFSYIEVISHNLDTELYNYSKWNCFIILIKYFSPKF